ncbi:hypothetical protein L345_10461, partial [Ophiophagus hannah]
MKALSLTLLYLGSALFFGVDATKLDIASNFKRNLETRRIRTKREPACKLSICVTQDLINRLNQWTDSSKDISAPPKQLTISGYGRRRRSFAFLVQG